MDTALAYFMAAILRSVGLFALALAAIAILRIGSAAARHALWTAVATGMLLLAILSPLAPTIALRVLPAAPAPAFDLTIPAVHDSVAPQLRTPARPAATASRVATGEIVLVLYLLVTAVLLARLAFGYLFTRRLVHAAQPAGLGPGVILESTWISIPLTVGWLRPKILLPDGWRDWPPEKLAAVLAHERTHVRRADWAIAILAGVNRCIYWFHPLAWWLERKLASLAEHACDDAALLEMESREPYAQALLDMALAVRSGRGRLVWEAMAMARASEVRMRVERILDETRQIPRGVSRRRWAVLAACGLPLIYFASVIQLEPALAQVQNATPTSGVTKLTRADAAAMEQQLSANPDDLQTRSRLIAYYFLNNVREPRLGHILWLVQHHPESEPAAFNAGGISPRPNNLNTSDDYQRVATLWRQQVAAHADDDRVIANAAQFFSQPGGDWYEAERLLQQAENVQPNRNLARPKLIALYVRALKTEEPFAQHVSSELEASNDGLLLRDVGQQLTGVPDRSALGERLLARAKDLGVTLPPRAAALPVVNTPPQQPPAVLRRVEPEYPTAARNLRLSGTVRVQVKIGPDGHVTNTSVLMGHPLFVQSATDAVKQWTFAPVLQNGIPVPAEFAVNVAFPLPPDLQAQVNAEAKPPVPQRIRVGGNVQKAMLLTSADPVYPEAARTAGPDGGPLEGTVTLRIVIAKDGTVQSVEPVEGHPLLAAAAEEAVKQSTYKPTLLNGQPVEVSTTVEVPFTVK